MFGNLRDLLHGFLFGIANIIPGVSGGTLALVLGFYHRLLEIINGITPQFIQEFWMQIVNLVKSKSSKNGLIEFLKQKDFFFLARIVVGAAIAVLSLSALMNYLLEHSYAPTYAFFFGLIAVSVIVPAKLVSKWKWTTLILLVLGVIIAAGSVFLVDPVANALGKSQILEAKFLAQEFTSAIDLESHNRWGLTGKFAIGEYLMVFVSGAIAVSAMVLPGVSGSFVLIMMGQYFTILQTVAGLRNLILDDFLYLGIFALGMVVGLLVFARVLDWFFRKAPQYLMAFLTGLIAGSLYVLWPFKRVEMHDLYSKTAHGIQKLESLVITNQNIFPIEPRDLVYSIVSCILGAGLMVFVLKLEKRSV
jgi:putative membrane protein